MIHDGDDPNSEANKKQNVLRYRKWGSDVLKFSLKWGLAMFLRCSYFFQKLSLDVLIYKIMRVP